MYTADQSKFQFLSAAALASRRIVDESSYTTTPDQSPADPIPPCGEAIYRRNALNKEGLKAVDVILEQNQTSAVKQQMPFCENINGAGPRAGNNEVNENKSAIGREREPSNVSSWFKSYIDVKLKGCMDRNPAERQVNLLSPSHLVFL